MRLDELPQPREIQRLHQPVIIPLQQVEGQVLAQRPREQPHVLPQIPHRPPQVLRLDLAHLGPVDQKTPLRRPVKPRQHPQERGLARPVRAQNGHPLPRQDGQRRNIQHRRRLGRIAELHLAQLEMPAQPVTSQIAAPRRAILRRMGDHLQRIQRRAHIAPARHRARQLRQRRQRAPGQDTDRDDRPHRELPRKHQIGPQHHRRHIGRLLHPLRPCRQQRRQPALLG